MDSVVSVLSWIWYNFFDRAAMFMMVLVFIGQLLTKRPFLESLMGALKAYIGYIVYQTATGGLYTTFQPIMMGLRQVLGMNIIVNDDSLGAGTLTAILENLDYTSDDICSCSTEFTVETEIGTEYEINLTEYFARCDTWQAALTQKQADTIREIIERLGE